MPALERDKIESSLTKKGFEEAPGDHKFFRLMLGGKYTGIFTKTSRGTKYRTLNNDLVSKMAGQLQITTKEFVRLVDCSMGGDEYVALLTERDKL